MTQKKTGGLESVSHMVFFVCPCLGKSSEFEYVETV